MFSKAEQRFYSPAAKEKAARQVQGGGPIPFSEVHPTSLHAPGYPYFLYAVWKILGKNPTAFLAISLCQALLISSLVFPIRWLTLRWFGSKAATWAMWITCLMPLYAYYATRLLPVAVFISLHPWLLVGWLKLKDNLTLTRSLGMGFCTGVAGLFQPLVLAFFGLIGLSLLVELIKKRSLDAVKLLASAVMVVLVLAPWTVRNFRVQGQFVPIRTGAGPFWIGNNPHSTGAAVIKGGAEDIYLVYPPKCIKLGTELTEAQYHNAMRQEAIDYIRSDPMGFVERTAKKIVWFWTWVPSKYLVNRPGEMAGVQYRILSIGCWLAFVALSVLARLLHGRFPPEYVMVLVIYVVVCSIMYGLIHVGQARFRGEIEYIFIPAAACGFAVAWNYIKTAFATGKSYG